MKKKICVVITSRASYPRIKTVLDHLALSDNHLQIVTAASAVLERSGNISRQIATDGFWVDAEVHSVVSGENLTSMAKTTGVTLTEMVTTFNHLKPDLVVTIADRYETLATAIAASYLNIPLVHHLAGEVTGSIDNKVRDAVTSLSDFALCPTIEAAKITEGRFPSIKQVFKTGCPSIDVANDIVENPEIDFDPVAKYGGVGPFTSWGSETMAKPYIVVLQHPVTTEYDDARSQVEKTLAAIKRTGAPTMWFWPNLDAGSDMISTGIRHFRENNSSAPVQFFINMSPSDFMKVVNKSACIVGNSSVAIRECSYLGVPAVNIGTRQEGRLRGWNVTDVGYDTEIIYSAISRIFARITVGPNGETMEGDFSTSNGRLDSDTLYGDAKAGKRIASILDDIVQWKNTWKKIEYSQ